MPCDSVITNTVDLPSMHPDLLTRALKQIGAANVTQRGAVTYFSLGGNRYVLSGGQLTSQDASQSTVEKTAGQLKQGYSHQVVQATAARAGWTLKQTGNNTYSVTRR